MGRGDKRTRRGKIFKGSYGNARKQVSPKQVSPKKVAKPTGETAPTAKKAPAAKKSK